MSDKELADKIVALGVGVVHYSDSYDISSYSLPEIQEEYGYYESEDFVRDWRVAGALMEICWERELELYATDQGCKVALDNQLTTVDGVGVPARAIIEACCEALT